MAVAFKDDGIKYPTMKLACKGSPYVCECDACFEEGQRQQAAEIYAENAWLRAAEYDPQAQDEMYAEGGW